MFLQPQILPWLALIPLLALALVLCRRHRMSRLDALRDSPSLKAWQSTRHPTLQWAKWLLVLLAAAGCLLALADPAWGLISKKVQRQGRQVVFLVDLSRSMLAKDLRPNRLERAKAEIAQCLEVLQGDRVSLVGFAGTAAVLCPPTLDYAFFQMALNEMSPNALARGGTNLGDALRMVRNEIFNESTGEGRDVILITDGEDHDSLPIEAAKALGALKVRLLIVGLGDDKAGTLLSLPDEQGQETLLKYNGQPVRSRLDSETLQAMADATPGGVYLAVGTRDFDLRDFYRQTVSTAKQETFEEESLVQKEKRYHLFLLPAMILLALGVALPTGKRPPKPGRLALLLLALLLFPQASQGASPRASFRRGTKALQTGNWEEAQKAYQECRDALPADRPTPRPLLFNQALLDYHAGECDQAETALRSMLEEMSEQEESSPLEQKAHLALANVLVRSAEKKATAQPPEKKPLEDALKQVTEAIQEYETALETPTIEDKTPVRQNLKCANSLKSQIERLLEQVQQQEEQQQEQQQQEQQSQEQQSQEQQSQEQQPQEQQQQEQQQQEQQQQEQQPQNQQPQEQQPQEQQPQEQQPQEQQSQEQQQQEQQSQEQQPQEQQPQEQQPQEQQPQEQQSQEQQSQEQQPQEQQSQEQQSQEEQQSPQEEQKQEKLGREEPVKRDESQSEGEKNAVASSEQSEAEESPEPESREVRFQEVKEPLPADLQKLLDQERVRRLRKRQMTTPHTSPVDKDW